jgi:hypothetical protein
MSNPNERRAREEAKQRQAKIDAERKALRHVAEGNITFDLISSIKSNSSLGRAQNTHDQSRNPSHNEERTLRIGKAMIWLWGVGVGSLSNHLSGSPYTVYVSWAFITIPGVWLTIGKNRYWKIGFAVFSVALFCVFYEIYEHDIASIEASAMSGFLLPANDPTPPISPSVPTNAMIIFLGNQVHFTESFPHIVIAYGTPDTMRPIVTLFTNKIGIAVSASFFGDNGNVVCVLESNRFIVNPSNYLLKESPDKSTLIVRDQKNIEVLNIRFLNPHAIRLEGFLRLPNGHALFISRSKGPFADMNTFGASVVDWLVQ